VSAKYKYWVLLDLNYYIRGNGTNSTFGHTNVFGLSEATDFNLEKKTRIIRTRQILTKISKLG
jgi:hypothetical protein